MKNRKTRKVVRAPDADEEKKKKQTPRFLLPHHCYAWHKGLLRNERGKHNNRAVNARRNKRCAADVEETHSSESDANTKKKKEKRNPKKKKEHDTQSSMPLLRSLSLKQKNALSFMRPRSYVAH